MLRIRREGILIPADAVGLTRSEEILTPRRVNSHQTTPMKLILRLSAVKQP